MHEGRIEGPRDEPDLRSAPDVAPRDVEADVLGNPEHVGDWNVDGDDYPAVRDDQARDPSAYSLQPDRHATESGAGAFGDAPRDLTERDVVHVPLQPDAPTRDTTTDELGRTALSDQVRLEPVGDATTGGTDGSDSSAPDVDAFDRGSSVDPVGRPDDIDDHSRTLDDRPDEYPSELADRRSDLWHQQGDNDLGYQGTCAIASSAEMLTDQLGEQVTENELVQHAVESGYCATELTTGDPLQQGGMDLGHVQMLHEDCGLESQRVDGWTEDQLAASVEQGDGVIAAVQAAEYWPADGFAPGQQDRERAMPGTDHAVWVTGVSRTEGGAITGVYVNDTGLPDGAKTFISSDDFSRAWQDRGGAAVVSRRT